MGEGGGGGSGGGDNWVGSVITHFLKGGSPSSSRSAKTQTEISFRIPD